MTMDATQWTGAGANEAGPPGGSAALREAGDDADFAEFYAATSRAATAQIYAMVGNWHEAQEAVQEAYARALPRWHHIRSYQDPLGWVRQVAYRIAVSRWRKARRVVRLRSDDDEQAAIPPAMEDHVALVGALQQLPAAQREALVLHYLADLPVAAVAAQLGVPEGTVKARLSRGRVALAGLLAAESQFPSQPRAAGKDRYV